MADLKDYRKASDESINDTKNPAALQELKLSVIKDADSPPSVQ